MGTYFGWAKRAEGHRISAIHYSKLYRFITVEMSLPREERMKPSDFLKYVKDQYDRLQEISPLIPPSVIVEFQSKFSKYTDISKPEEANGLEKIEVYHDSFISSASNTPVPKLKSVPSTPEMKANPLFKAKAVSVMKKKEKDDEKLEVIVETEKESPSSE
jgi:hypothetical protein